MATSSISASMSDYKVYRYCFLLPLYLFLYPLCSNAQINTRGEEIVQTIKKYGQAEVIIAYPGFDEMSRLAKDFSVSSCDRKEAVLCLSDVSAPAFINTGISYTLVKPDDTKTAGMASSLAEAMEWNHYPSYTQYDSIMHVLADLYPEMCRLDTIGTSINGRIIYAIKISDNVMEDEDEPKVFLSAAIHGDELCGFVLLMRLAEMLASQGSSDELVSRINQGLEVWINPLANPDGMYPSGDDIVYPVRTNANSVDLNRNFPDPEVNPGETIQKENVEMIAFLKKHHFALSVSFHSGAEVVNYPWDRWRRLHPDNEWFHDISRSYADTVHLHSSPDYMTFLDDGITNGAVWYVINGGRQDYVTWSLEGREVTIEIDDNKSTPADSLEVRWENNYRSFLRYINEALSGVHGIVTDSVTGMPVRSEVFISGHDADSSQVFSDETTGRYIRLLSPGTWDISFTADGYIPYIAEDVVVVKNEITNLDVALAKAESEIHEMMVFPVPSDNVVNFKLPSDMSGNVKILVTNTSGILVDSFTDYYLPGNPVSHSFSKLSSGVYIFSAKHLLTGKTVKGKIVIVLKEP